MTTNDTAIHTRALLSWLTISTWTARKYDKRITEKVNAELNASSDAGRYNKMLLPGDATAYKTLMSLASSIRVQHYNRTLAWSDEGWRLLPTASYVDYTDWLRERQNEFQNALDTFMDEYPIMKMQARRLLNGAYKEEDYPSVVDIRKKFKVDIQYAPIPAVGDIRVDLASDQIAALESGIVGRIETATKTAMTDAWNRLYDCVAHIADKLSEPDAIFRNSLIGNATEVCETLKSLNVTGDANLEAMRIRVLAELTKHEPDVLRENPIARQQTADKAQAIMTAMSGLYGEAV